MNAEQLASEIREVRRRYDELKRGESAPLRRCRSADAVALERNYWRVAGALGREERHLPHVVLMFPHALQSRSNRMFSFGSFLRHRVGDSPSGLLRFRRLLDSSDRDELDHWLRALLRLSCADGSPVDWGVLGRDILWFLGEKESVRRRWAQDFYAPLSAPGKAPLESNATQSRGNP